MRSHKERKEASSRPIFHVSSLTTGSPLQKQQEKVKNQQLKQDCISPDLQCSRTKRFSLQEFKTGASSWTTSTLLQAENSKLAWPRGSHPSRGTRVYNVLAYSYADYFDASTPTLGSARLVLILPWRKKIETGTQAKYRRIGAC